MTDEKPNGSHSIEVPCDVDAKLRPTAPGRPARAITEPREDEAYDAGVMRECPTCGVLNPGTNGILEPCPDVFHDGWANGRRIKQDHPFTTPDVYRKDLAWCPVCHAARETPHVCYPRKP